MFVPRRHLSSHSAAAVSFALVCACALLALSAFAPGLPAQPVADDPAVARPGALPSTASVQVLNRGSEPVETIQASVCDASAWGANLLADGPLAPEGEVLLSLGEGCWDLKAVSVSGEEILGIGLFLDAETELVWTVRNN